jgi:TusE/DsrC/DsvC family sulfur relay protein
LPVNVISPQRDDEGYLVNPGDWSRELAQALAREETLSLTEEHWVVITFVRDYYAEHGITPDIRHAAKHLAAYSGCDKKAGKARLFELFPYGYVQQTCKIAGMRRPRAWSTG